MAGDPYWNNVVLAMHMDDTGLTDLKGHAVTLNGNVARSPVQSPFGGYSAYFDGSGDYIVVAPDSGLALGAGDFTIEGFVFPTADGVGYLVSVGDSSGTASWHMQFRNTAQGNVMRFFNAAESVGYNGSLAVSLNAWHHIAFCRSGTTLRGFLDGVKCLEQTVSSNFSNVNFATVGGSVGQTIIATAACYIADLRITKGAARYTSNFTPPAAPFGGPYTVSGTVKDDAGNFVQRLVRLYRRDSGALAGEMFSDAVSGAFSLVADDHSTHFVVVNDADSLATYLAFDGANNSTQFTEWSGKMVTAYGNAKLSTAQSKFGGASAYFGDGTSANNRIEIPYSRDLSLTGIYTIEMWVYPTAIRAVNQLLFSPQTLGPVRVDIEANTGKITVIGSSNNTSWLFTGGFVSSVALTLNSWNHVVVVDDGTAAKIYINGVESASRATWSRSPLESGGVVLVGGSNVSGVDRTLTGYLDDLRISKGVARYVANFTPPVVAQLPAQAKNALIYDLLQPV